MEREGEAERQKNVPEDWYTLMEWSVCSYGVEFTCALMECSSDDGVEYVIGIGIHSDGVVIL